MKRPFRFALLALVACRKESAGPPSDAGSGIAELVASPAAADAGAPCSGALVDLVRAFRECPASFAERPPVGALRGLDLVTDRRGRSTSEPEGSCSVPRVVHEPMPTWAKITLAPKSEARARLRWHATTMRWGGPLPGPRPEGCALVAAGPLAAGTYTGHLMALLWTQHPNGQANAAEGFLSEARQLPITVE